MIWSLYAMLGVNMWNKDNPTVLFDDETWEKMVDAAAAAGLNTLVLDIGEGLQYQSHPELAHPGAWSVERAKREVQSLKEKGIALIPKLNFSAAHDLWLGQYAKMLCSDIYYGVCRDLIEEVYEVFDRPAYIHLGMDEEDALRCFSGDYVAYRRGELLFHDLKYFCDIVTGLGATPWVWSDLCFEYPALFAKYIDPEKVLLSPWHYQAFKKEHFTRIDSRPEAIEYYQSPAFAGLELTYIEEDPFFARFHEQILPCMAAGYRVVPATSTFNKCDINADDTMDFYMHTPDAHRVAGYMSAPWLQTTKENEAEILRGIAIFGDAKKKYYGE